MTTGDEIRRRREARGWTVAHLGALVGTTGQTISRIERNESEWSRYLPKILEILEMPAPEGLPQLIGTSKQPAYSVTALPGTDKLFVHVDDGEMTPEQILQMVEFLAAEARRRIR